MLCEGRIQEGNTERSCWLPRCPTSVYLLCRRCHFLRVTEILDRLTRDYEQGVLHPTNEMALRDNGFLEELLHPAREQALLNLLSSLYFKNKILFHLLVSRLETYRAFPIILKKRIETHTHQPGTRCSMYRVFLKKKEIYSWRHLCWGCWPCIAWSLKQRDKDLQEMYIQNFGLRVFQLTETMVLQIGSKIFLDLLVSLYLLGYHHHIRIIFDHMLRVFTADTFQNLLGCFFQQGPLLSVLFEGKQDEFLPLPFRDESVVNEFKKKAKLSIKKRTNLFKEELIQVTWHPDRFFEWCLDLED